jgi:hypothetical protein
LVFVLTFVERESHDPLDTHINIGVLRHRSKLRWLPIQSEQPDGNAVDDFHYRGDHDATDMAKMKAELAKLSPEDAASAEKQRFCPVSDEMLGTMGPPLKIDVNGTPVWICCKGCREELLAEPDKYLAKLKSE